MGEKIGEKAMIYKNMVVLAVPYICTVIAIIIIFMPSILATEHSSYNGTYLSTEYPTAWQVEENSTSLNFSDETTGHYVYIGIDEYYPTIAIQNNYSTFVNGSLDEPTMHLLKTLRFKPQALINETDRSKTSEKNQVTNNSQPENLSTLNDKGVDFYIQGRYDLALECYNKAIELDPNSSLAWNNKGALLLGQDKYESALQAFDRAVEIDPNYSSAWNNKGSSLYHLGKYEEALKSFDEAIKLNPKNANAWRNKANALKRLGKTSEADEAFSKAKELGHTG